MSYLIDTDWVIGFLGGRQPALDLVNALLLDDIAISVVTYLEVLEGIRGGRDLVQSTATFDRFLEAVDVLEIDCAIAGRAADLRLALRR